MCRMADLYFVCVCPVWPDLLVKTMRFRIEHLSTISEENCRKFIMLEAKRDCYRNMASQYITWISDKLHQTESFNIFQCVWIYWFAFMLDSEVMIKYYRLINR